jgi:hypothetical protein
VKESLKHKIEAWRHKPEDARDLDDFIDELIVALGKSQAEVERLEGRVWAIRLEDRMNRNEILAVIDEANSLYGTGPNPDMRPVQIPNRTVIRICQQLLMTMDALECAQRLPMDWIGSDCDSSEPLVGRDAPNFTDKVVSPGRAVET